MNFEQKKNNLKIGTKANLTIGVKAEIVLIAIAIVADLLIIFLLPGGDDVIFSVSRKTIYIFLILSATGIILIIGRSIGRKNKSEKDLMRYNRSNRFFLLVLFVGGLVITIISLINPESISMFFAGEFDLGVFFATDILLQIGGVGALSALVIGIIAGIVFGG